MPTSKPASLPASQEPNDYACPYCKPSFIGKCPYHPSTPVVPAEPTNEFLWYVSGSSICEPAGTIAENLPKEVAELIVRTHNQEIEAFCRATTPSPVSREPLAKQMSKAELADYLDCPVPIRDLWNRLIELEEHVGTHDLKEFEPCEICREGGEYDTVRRQYEKAAIEYVDDLMQGQKSPSPEDWKKAKDFARGES